MEEEKDEEKEKDMNKMTRNKKKEVMMMMMMIMMMMNLMMRMMTTMTTTMTTMKTSMTMLMITRGGATTWRHDNRKTVATHGGMSRLRTFTSNDWWPRPRVSCSVSGEMFFLFTCQFSPLCA